VERSGCIIEELLPDNICTLSVCQQQSLDEYLSGHSDYWATIRANNARASIFFLKEQTIEFASDDASKTIRTHVSPSMRTFRDCSNTDSSKNKEFQECCTIWDRDHLEDNQYLVPSLYYMLVASGGILTSLPKNIFKQTALFQATENIYLKVLSLTQANEIQMFKLWSADRDAEVSSKCEFVRLSCYLGRDVCKLAFGPSMSEAGDHLYYLAVIGNTSFLGFRKNKLYDVITKLILMSGGRWVTPGIAKGD
jgi:hypothetical protein